MVKEYQTDDVAVFTISFLTQTGEEATVTGSPTISLDKYDIGSDSWINVFSGSTMINKSDSTWYYEIDTSSLDSGSDYRVGYSATIDSLDVKAFEDWRLVNTKNDIVNEIKELRKGNERVTFSYSGDSLVSMTIQTKADSASDWSSPTSEKTLYFTYSGDKLIKVGES